MNQDALTALRKEVIDAIYGQSNWLDSMTVAVPEQVEPTLWVRTVETMLADLHLDGVDVAVECDCTEAPWLRSFELKPGWA